MKAYLVLCLAAAVLLLGCTGNQAPAATPLPTLAPTVEATPAPVVATATPVATVEPTYEATAMPTEDANTSDGISPKSGTGSAGNNPCMSTADPVKRAECEEKLAKYRT